MMFAEGLCFGLSGEAKSKSWESKDFTVTGVAVGSDSVEVSGDVFTTTAAGGVSGEAGAGPDGVGDAAKETSEAEWFAACMFGEPDAGCGYAAPATATWVGAASTGWNGVGVIVISSGAASTFPFPSPELA
jgi:hypothetical protein